MRILALLLSLALVAPAFATDYEKATRAAEEHRQRMTMQKILQLAKDQDYRERAKQYAKHQQRQK